MTEPGGRSIDLQPIQNPRLSTNDYIYAPHDLQRLSTTEYTYSRNNTQPFDMDASYVRSNRESVQSNLSTNSMLDSNLKHEDKFDTPANLGIARLRGLQKTIAADPRRKVKICSNPNEFASYRYSYELYLAFGKRLIFMITGLILLSAVWEYLEHLLCGSSVWFGKENEFGSCSWAGEFLLFKFGTNTSYMFLARWLHNKLDALRQTRYQKEFKMKRLSEKKYCFIIKNIAPNTTPFELKNHIENIVLRQRSVVKDIFFLKDTTKLGRTLNKLKKSSMTASTEETKQELFDPYEDSRSPYFNGCAIVYCHLSYMVYEVVRVFKQQRVRSALYFYLRRCCNPNYKKEVYFKNRIIEAWQLEDPNDIIWKNIHHSVRGAEARTMVAYIFMFLYLCAFFYSNYFLTQYILTHTKISTEQVADQVRITAFSLGLVLNMLIAKMLIKVLGIFIRVPGELNKVRFEFAISIVLSYLAYSLAYFLHAIVFGEDFLLKNKSLQTLAWILLFTVINGVAPFHYLIKAFQRCRLRSQGLKNKKMQFQADEIFTNPEITMQERANLLIQPVFLAMTVYMVVPGVLLAALIVLLVNYYLDKYNLIYRWRISKRKTPEIAYKIYFPISFDILIITQANALFVYDWQNLLAPWYYGSVMYYFLAGNIVLTIIYYMRRFFLTRVEKNERKITLNTAAPYEAMKNRFTSTYKGTYPYTIQRDDLMVNPHQITHIL